MTLQRAEKPFAFRDGRTVMVQEANWDIAATRDHIRDQAIAEKAKLNGHGDPVKLYFQEVYYAYLASCSSGDVPTLEEALELPAEDLDGWYAAVMAVNPRWFTELDLSARETVTFGDALTFTIVSAYRPSAVMKRLRLELAAEQGVEDPQNLDVFSWYVYPRLAGCTVGDLPTADELRREWPESEIYRWTDAARRVNPHWFGGPEQAAERVQAETLEAEKKKDRKRKRS